MEIRDSFGKISEKHIANLESKVGQPLPKEYRSFLLKDNGGRPEPDNFRTADGEIETDIQFFYGITKGGYDISRTLDVFKERIPDGMIPIGNDSLGNQIMLELLSKKIFYFDHETEESHLVSNSFSAFTKVLFTIEIDETAFDVAIEEENIEYFKSLLSNTTKIDDIKNEFDQTAFIRSCMMGKLKIVKELVEMGANIEGGLSIASERGYIELMEFLIDAGADLEEVEEDMNQSTPFIVAAHHGQLEAVKLLIRAGADIYATDKYDNSAREKARWSDNKELVRYFEEVIYKI